MDTDAKQALLCRFGTKGLLLKLDELENDLVKALNEQTRAKTENAGYLSSGDRDCVEVKRILAELTVQPSDGKKLTVPEREAWLQKQRTENPTLKVALERQEKVSALLAHLQITVEMAREKLSNVRIVLALRTAQINFLAS